jgi:hypothetical protein
MIFQVITHRNVAGGANAGQVAVYFECSQDLGFETQVVSLLSNAETPYRGL